MNWNISILFCIAIFSMTPLKLLSLTYEDFKEEPNLRDLSISPNGRYLATITNEGNLRTVNIVDLKKSGAPIATFGDEVVRPIYLKWANNERLLIDISAPMFKRTAKKKAERGEDIDEDPTLTLHRTIAMTPGKKGYVELLRTERRFGVPYSNTRIYSILPNDDEHILKPIYHQDRLALFKVNVYTGKAKRFVIGGRNTFSYASDANERILYRFDWLPQTQAIQIYDYTAEGKWTEKERIYYDRDDGDLKYEDFAGAIADGSLIYRKLNEKTGYYEIISRNRDGIKNVFASHPNKDILYLLRNNHSSEVIGYTYEQDGVIVAKYFDKKSQAEYEDIQGKLKKIGGSGFFVTSRHKKSDIIAILTTGPDDPGIYFLYNRINNDLALYGFTHHRLPPSELGVPATTQYKTRDGESIESFLLFPPNYKKGTTYPMVMMPHGGPHSRTYAHFDTFAQFLATRGYLVFKPNFRGSTGYGKKFEEAGYREWGGLMMRDIEDGVKFSIKNRLADPNKICILGFSFGGYAALMGALNKEKLYRCAVSLNGVTHLPKLIKHDEKAFKGYDRTIQRVYERIGHPKNDKEMIRHHSPALRAAEIDIPVLLVGGEWDTVVPYDQQKIMKRALKRNDVDFEFISLEKTFHNPISTNKNINIVYPAVEQFLKKYLD